MTDAKKGVILITGSAGRIGARMAERLGKKYHIVGFELMKAIYASQNEELVPLDVSSEESVQQAFLHIKNFYGTHITSVIHLAAYYSFSDPSYEKYKKITVEGTRNLLKALQEFEVEQFLFSSTMLVHEPCKLGKKIKETSPKKASWAYPKSKIETEAVIHKYSKEIPSVILRISGVYDDHCHSIPISNQIQRIYEKQLAARVFPGNIKHGASFMHMDDLVDAMEMCVEKRKTLPKETVLLIGEEDTMSTDELQRAISQEIFHKEIKTWRIPKWMAYIGVWIQCHIPFMKKPFIRPWMIKLADDNYVLDISKAKKVLGWKPKKSLRKELPKMIQLLLKDPKAFYKENNLQAPKKKMKQWTKPKKKR